MEEGPVFSAGMSSIRRVVEALATQLEANRLATKRKIGPSREDEVYYSVSVVMLRHPTNSFTIISHANAYGASRVKRTVKNPRTRHRGPVGPRVLC